MRRGFSIFLILFFGFGPLAAFAGSEDAGLPQCCRRHGAHHCAMNAQNVTSGIAVGSTPSLSAPPTCPLYHGPALSMLMPAHALTASGATLRGDLTHVSALPIERIAAFSTPNRTHAGRGPPAATPS
ncbi:MAG TPA: hypothetical protein VGG45_15745 [Terracidiphilus sp.]|jgi:hypothetical protein